MSHSLPPASIRVVSIPPDLRERVSVIIDGVAEIGTTIGMIDTPGLPMRYRVAMDEGAIISVTPQETLSLGKAVPLTAGRLEAPPSTVVAFRPRRAPAHVIH